MDGYFSAFFFYLVYFTFGIIGLILTIRFIPRKYFLGYILAKPLGLIIFAYPIWLLTSLRIIKFNNHWLLIGLFWCAIIVSAFNIARYVNRSGNEKLKEYIFSKNSLKKILVYELFSLLFFYFYLYLRSFKPDIGISEKAMDFFLLNSAGKTDYFPFFDGWWASKPINYYYYGYYLFALLTRISGSSFSYAYNFSIAIIFTQSTLLVFSIVYKLTKSKLFSSLGVFFVLIAGNLHFTLCYLKNYGGNMTESCTYGNASRVVQPMSYTINEFPSLNFVQGDLHPHVISIPFFLSSLYLIFLIYKFKVLNKYLMFTFLITLATVALINTWDFITIGIIFALVVLKKINNNYRLQLDKNFKSTKAWKELFLESKSWIVWSIILLISPFILFLPFFLNFESPVAGIGFIPEYVNYYKQRGYTEDFQWPSTPMALFSIYGVFLVTSALSLLFLKLKQKSFNKFKFPIFLLIVSLIAIAFTELFYIKDMFHVINPPFFRGNTVFKFGYHAWILLALSSAILLGNFWENIKRISSRNVRYFFTILLLFVSIMSIFSLGLFPIEAVRQEFNPKLPWQVDHELSLNGLKFIEKEYIYDWDTINWVNENVKERSVILEAVGGSYFFNGRIATYTGNANVINWYQHEWTWHFKYPPGITDWRETYGKSINDLDIGQREVARIGDEVVKIYETNNVEEARNLLKKYNVSYVYVGGIEKNYKNLNEQKFFQLGEVVYQTKYTKLFKVNI